MQSLMSLMYALGLGPVAKDLSCRWLSLSLDCCDCSASPIAWQAADMAAVRVGAGRLSEREVRDVVRSELAAAVQGRPKWEQVASFVMLREGLSVEDGTLTRTMKPRRPAIFAKYSTEIAQLQAALR